MTKKLKAFIIKPREIVHLKYEMFVITRQITGPYRRFRRLDYTPEQITGLLAFAPYVVGQRYWLKEQFRVRFDSVREQSWVQYTADNQIATGAAVHGHTGFVDGTFKAVLMKKWMSRGEVEVANVQVLYTKYIPNPTQYQTDKRDWCWEVTFRTLKGQSE